MYLIVFIYFILFIFIYLFIYLLNEKLFELLDLKYAYSPFIKW